jgi:uroporphyrinogen-III decarboxylase
MFNKTMTSEERMLAAINLEEPDHVPVSPFIGLSFSAKFLGLTEAELHADPEKAVDALIKVFDTVGGWDVIVHVPLTELFYHVGGLAVKVPGKQLPSRYQLQFDEKELLKIEDYKKISDMGWRRFLVEEHIPRIINIEKEDVSLLWKRYENLRDYTIKAWERKGAFLKVSNYYLHPFFFLSLNRSLLKFTEDLYYRPNLVETALEVMTEELIERGFRSFKRIGGKCIYLVEERASAYFYPLKIFERFWWPYTKRMVEAWHSKGIITFFHLDQCWDKNIPYFKELPRASAVVDLDGSTDIFAASKVLRGHLCISSDVNATLLSIGKPGDVKAYCKKLIDKLGVGHILSSGCEVPPTCKIENLLALIETGKTYKPKK